jgi:hypothetical protein
MNSTTRTHAPSHQVAADLADAINARNAHTTQRAESAVHVLLAVVLAVLGAMALLHFATPCPAAMLCMSLALVTPTTEEPRLDERVSAALQTSYQHGHDDGEFSGYVEGWRWGLFHGLVVGVALGAFGGEKRQPPRALPSLPETSPEHKLKLPAREETLEVSSSQRPSSKDFSDESMASRLARMRQDRADQRSHRPTARGPEVDAIAIASSPSSPPSPKFNVPKIHIK